MHRTAASAMRSARAARSAAIGNEPPRYANRPSADRRCAHGTSGVNARGPTRNATLAANPGTYSRAIMGPGQPTAVGTDLQVCPKETGQTWTSVPTVWIVACDPAPSRGFTTTVNAGGSSPSGQV